MSYEDYDLQENDPYLIAGSTCLLNSLGILDTQLLNEAEKEISAAAYAELILSPVRPTFDLSHLCQIHRRLFGDIYPWAGEIRTTEIAKGNKLFLPYRLIAKTIDAVFEELQQEAFLKGLPPLPFAHRAGYYLGESMRFTRLEKVTGGPSGLCLINSLSFLGMVFNGMQYPANKWRQLAGRREWMIMIAVPWSACSIYISSSYSTGKRRMAWPSSSTLICHVSNANRMVLLSMH